MKYDPVGVALWVRTARGGKLDSGFSGVAARGARTVCAAGSLFGGSTYGFGGSAEAAGPNADRNVLLVSYSNN